MTDDRIAGRYRVLRQLGRGGMGVVHLVEEDGRDRPIALKVLDAGRFSDSALRHFEQEFRLHTALTHPNLTEVFDFGRMPGPDGRAVPFFTMEFVDGEPIHRAFRPSDLDLPRLLRAIAQVGQALAYLHARGWIHQDVKPSNILVVGSDREPRVKLMDLGLAGRPGEIPGGGRIRGTPAYLAPEVARGGEPDPRSDLYSLGCTWFEILTGRTPFQAASAAESIRAHLVEEPIPASALNRAVPPEIDAMLRRLLAKDPAVRFPGVGPFLAALNEAAGGGLDVATPETRRRSVLGAGFVGRESELARLDGWAAEAEAGRGRLVLVEGEAGVGKSRLIREFQVRCQIRGQDVFVGGYEGADAAVGSLAGALRRASAARPAAAAEVRARFGDVLDGLLGDGDPSGVAEGRALDGLGCLVEDLARGAPLVLAVEDLHEADEPTCATLSHLARRVSAATTGRGLPVLLLGTYRGAEVSRSSPLFDLLAEGREAGVVEELFLGPLPMDDVRGVLRAMIGTPSVPDPFVERVFDETRGNPLHVQELIAFLAEGGVIRPGTGESPAADALDGVPLPGRIRALLERRLGGLDSDAANVLRAAALLDARTVDPDAVAAVTGLRGETVFDRVLELHRRGLIARAEDDTGAPAYHFAHRGLVEIARAATPPEEATALHRQAASYLERRGVPRRHAAWGAFARHAELGGLPGRALEAYGRAGDLAAEAHAHRDAVQWFARAIDLANRASGSAALVCGLYDRRGDVHAVAGDLARSEEDYRWMLARAEKDGSPALRARAHLRLGGILGRTARDHDARESLEIAWSVAQRERDAEILAAASLELGRLAARAGDLEEASRHLDAARASAGRAGRPDLATETLIVRGELLRDHGDYAGALRAFREAEEVAGDRAAGATAAAIQEGAALSLEVQGDYPGALAALERARQRARERGDVHAVARLTSRLAKVRVRVGDPAGAARDFDEALAIHERLGDREGAISNRVGIARMHLDRGRYETALELAEDARRAAVRLGRRDLLASVLEALGEIHLSLGDVERAGTRIDEADRLLRDARNVRTRASALLRAGDLALVAGRGEDARSRFQEAAFLFRRVGDRRLEASAMVRLGEAHLVSKDHDRARVACRKARSLLEGASLPREQADVRLLQARVELAAPGGDVLQAEQDALAALEGFRALGEPDRTWQAEHVAGRAGMRLGRAADAFERIRRAHRFLEKVRARLGARWQGTFLHDPRRRELYEDWERLRRSRPEAGEPAEVRTAGELARAKEEAAALRRMLEINRALNRSRDTDVLLGTVLDAAVELTGAERGVVLEVDDGNLTVRHARGRGGETLDTASIDLSRSIASSVLASGEPLLSTDAEADDRLAPYESVHELRIRSVLAVPLSIQDERVGVVYLDTRTGPLAFRDEHLARARMLAEQAGLTLDSARLLARIQAQREDVERLNRELERTVSDQREELESVREELSSSRTSFELRYKFESLIGASAPMQRVYHVIEKLAPKRLPILITGESGTGKELIARAIHTRSDRADGPFFTVNCAALTESLLESELFGYRKGAFTGADRDKPGYFELAHGGTLFLDEIGEMGGAMQAKLLRVIERGEVLPVGGKATVNVDVRIIAATHRDLPARIAEGAFREDLYYRVNVGRIEVPPLRERREDIPLLVDHFLTAIAEDEGREKFEIESAALRRLCAWRWPGNVRELQHQILRVATFARGTAITQRDVERYGDLPDPATETAQGDEARVASLEETERRQIVLALEQAEGNRTRAAEILGINRATLFRKIKRLELDV